MKSDQERAEEAMMNYRERVKEIVKDLDPVESYILGRVKGHSEGYADGQYNCKPAISKEEEAYRRGFSHGWHVGITKPDATTSQKIREWKYNAKIMGAPGTPYENYEFK